MKSFFKPLLVVLVLALAGVAQAAPTPTGNGYYGSVTWDTGWGNPLVTHSVGPYLTYGDCYTAWMNLSFSQPQWWIQSMQQCSLHATHQEMLTLDFVIDVGGAGNPVGEAEDAKRLAEQVLRIRRQFNADAYEEALRKVR